MHPRIFDPLFHVLNLAVTTITNFPGSTYQEMKIEIELICNKLEIRPINIGINQKQNIVYVTTETEDALKLMENTNKSKYHRSILESSIESFSEKHPLPFQYINSKIDNAIRKELIKNVEVKFDASKKQTIRYVLGQLIRDNDINSLGIIFSNNNTVANVHVRNNNANKLTKLIENSNINDMVTYNILEVGDNFIPPPWFKEMLMKEILNSEAPGNPTEEINQDLDDDLVLEINSEVSVNGPVLEINCEAFLRGDPNFWLPEEYSFINLTDDNITLDTLPEKENTDSNLSSVVLVTSRVEKVSGSRSYAAVLGS